MLADAEAKVARLREISFSQLVLLHLQAPLEDLLRLGPADRDMHGDLLVTSDAERSHGVASFAFSFSTERLARFVPG